MILKDKVIIVTGGSGLIGKELISDINLKGGKAINADIAAETNLKKMIIKMDITDDKSIQNGIDLVVSEFGRIDGLVNNAYPRTKDWGNKFENIDPDSWRSNINMQLNSYFVCCQKVLRIMEKQQRGAIVNIASIYGVVGNDFTLYEEYGGTSPAAYSAIKGGLINFTRYLASYYGHAGIRVNCVSPGGIYDNQHPSFVSRYIAKVPMRRLGKPDDIAPVVSFMLSDESKYITGQNIIVDGGWTAI
ncbi:MAG: short-chain dehydrogenase [Bacteroidetes bacterium HGW-Bacteroidetes-21]|jgi:NAD(P)-dependent dehydrogenase (short-subunit alcohol dehydrogenase family)|nr:MAG: short-chain dehydrogenase [Bacteroidetes bacterium HGW-Bacteroidetes-21]